MTTSRFATGTDFIPLTIQLSILLVHYSHTAFALNEIEIDFFFHPKKFFTQNKTETLKIPHKYVDYNL